MCSTMAVLANFFQFFERSVLRYGFFGSSVLYTMPVCYVSFRQAHRTTEGYPRNVSLDNILSDVNGVHITITLDIKLNEKTC